MRDFLETERLRLAPLSRADRDAFHSLVVDPHVRRYLMDGQVLPVSWSEEQIEASTALFEQHGVGLWLARSANEDPGEAVGFCGFMGLPGTGLGFELVYALREAHTRGASRPRWRRA